MRITRMEVAQCAISIAVAFAFHVWQADDPLPTKQSWLVMILVVGFGAAWLATQIIVRLASRHSALQSLLQWLGEPVIPSRGR